MSDNRTLAKGAMIGGAPVYFQEEATTDTAMASTSAFRTTDVNGKPVDISRDNIMGIVKECLGTILSDNSADLGSTITKALALNNSTLGAITPANLASVLGGILPLAGTYDDSSILSACENLKSGQIKYNFSSSQVYLLINHSSGTMGVYKILKYASTYTLELNKRHNGTWIGWGSINFV